MRPRGWAKAVTDVLSPAHFVLVLPPIIGWHATAPSLSGLPWGLFCAALAGGVPYGFVIHAVLRRRISDIHIRTPWVLAFAPLVVLICAARLVLRDHTFWQLVAGVALGGVLSPLSVLALR